jgi:RHS repeat-associated protein
MWLPNENLANNNAAAIWDTIGKKQYELTNHLGNVMATITDKRIQFTISAPGNPTFYFPNVTTENDYFAFELPMQDRSLVVNQNYRYGFNGKENDNEVRPDASIGENTGGEQDYGMRIYDPVIGKFLSTDPIANSFPGLSSYQFASNSPILNTDLDGLEASTSSKKVVKNAAGDAALMYETQELVKQSLSKSVVNESGELILERGVGTAFGLLAKTLGLTISFVLMPQSMGNDTHPMQRITTDPEKLSNFEVQQIMDRISKSQATAQDLLYQHRLSGRYSNGIGQLLDKAPSSAILSFNLLSAGINRPSQTAAHHIVAGNDPRAAEARSILKREGIDINEAVNGVFLPKNSKYEDPPAATHSTLHTNLYYETINSRLREAQPGKVTETLNVIGKELLNGTFPQ